MPALEFSWAQLLLPAFDQTSLSLFAVVKHGPDFEANKSETTFLSNRMASNTGFELEIQQSGAAFARFFKGGQSMLKPDMAMPAALNTPFIAGLVLAPDAAKFTANGTLKGVNYSYLPSMMQKMSIGFKTGDSGAGNFNGQIAEVLLFTRALTDEECKSVMSYLAARYKIAVK